jgi:hypothetical protein
MDGAFTRSPTTYFWMGLAGIMATGLIAGMGGDNYWAFAHFGSLRGASCICSRGHLLLFAVGVLTGTLDLSALGVMFAGSVVFVQRLRGLA